jgi:putative tryptophan/tyrosine transport system substrate-binding protein
MRRREFIKMSIGGSVTASLALPKQLRAQASVQTRRVGVLIARAESDPEGSRQAAALERGLSDLGWSRGRNLQLDIRWQSGDPAKRLALVKELVELRPDVLVVNSTPFLLLARQAASAVPIVFVAIADPVAQGFVQSLARPGGTLTGFGAEEPSMGAKWMELLKEMAPDVRSVTVMFNPDTAPFPRMFLPPIRAVQSSASLQVTEAPVHNEPELERAIEAAGARPTPGLIFLPDSFLASRVEIVIGLVAKKKLPAVYSVATFPRAGGLVALGIERVDIFLRTATYVDRILKGERPSDLPVQMPSKFELIVNLKTAKLLRLTVPPTVLARADEVIE